jgi:SseB protein N-terminal domain
VDEGQLEPRAEFSDGTRCLLVWGTGPGADLVNPGSELFVPLTGDPPDQWERLPGGMVRSDGLAGLGLFATDFPDGRTAVFAFTSVDELLEWKPEGGPWMAVPLADLLEWVSGRHELVWINSAGESVVVEEVMDGVPGVEDDV